MCPDTTPPLFLLDVFIHFLFVVNLSWMFLFIWYPVIMIIKRMSLSFGELNRDRAYSGEKVNVTTADSRDLYHIL